MNSVIKQTRRGSRISDTFKVQSPRGSFCVGEIRDNFKQYIVLPHYASRILQVLIELCDFKPAAIFQRAGQQEARIHVMPVIATSFCDMQSGWLDVLPCHPRQVE